MRIVLDTNILLRLVETLHPQHEQVSDLIMSLRARNESFFVFLQNISAFWNVCTRPVENNGLGLSISDTEDHLSRFEQLFTVLPDTAEVYRNWRELVIRYSVTGVKVHDAKIVAAMMAHGIDRLLTFNIADFNRFTEISAITPDGA